MEINQEMKTPLICALIIFVLLSCSLEEKEIVLEATLVDDLANLHLELFKDSTFQLISNNILGSNIESKGEYSLKGDWIWFHDNPYKNYIPNQVLIEKDKLIFKYNSDGSIDTSFASYFQIATNRLSDTSIKNH